MQNILSELFETIGYYPAQRIPDLNPDSEFQDTWYRGPYLRAIWYMFVTPFVQLDPQIVKHKDLPWLNDVSMYSITSAEDLLLFSKALSLYQQQSTPKIWIHLAEINH